MSHPFWFDNLAAYSLQIALLAGVGTVLPFLFRLRAPRVMLAYWQALLAACLLLPLIQPWQKLPVEGAVTSTVNAVQVGLGGPARPLFTFPVLKLIAVALLLGMIAKAARLLLGFLRLRSLRRKARVLASVPECLHNAQARCAGATLYLSSEIGSPATFGLLHPAILLPAKFSRMAPDLQQGIVRHEILHVERRDWLFNLGEELLLAVFWFHPAVWWLVDRIRLAREQVVDAEVVRWLGERKPYLYALLEIAAGEDAPRLMVAPAFLLERQLAQRVGLIVKEVHMPKPRLIASLALAAAALVLAGGMAVWSFPLRTSARPAASPGASSAPAPQPALDTAPVSGQIYPARDVTAHALLPAVHPAPEPEQAADSKDVVKPVPIFKPEPKYTKEAKDAKVQGQVVLLVTIDAEGNVSTVKVTKPLGKGLDESAVQTVRTWKFKPALKNGKPVSCKSTVEINFKLY